MPKTNSNTSRNKNSLEDVLAGIPKKFRTRIIKEYLEIKKRYSEALYDSEYDTAGFSAGKFAETILRFLQQKLTGNYIAFGKHISNFPDECRKLIQVSSSAGVESLRVIMPRALVFLYTLRGKRGIGHIGGDVEANEIDLKTIVQLADWVTCELIRIYHNLSLEEAQAIVDVLSTRTLPDIWQVAGRRRILRTDLNFKQKVLLLTYGNIESGVLTEDLFSWTEHSNLSVFKRTVLKPLHNGRQIEYDRESEIIYISPLGIKEVEEKILRPSES